MVLRFPLCVFLGFAVLALCSGHIYADGPADNQPDQVRPIPPTGIEISSTVIEALEWRCQVLRAQWQSALKKDPSIAVMECEVLVFPRAVEMVIEFNQFYKANEPEQASVLLDESARRIEIIQRGGSWSDVVGIEVSEEPQLVIGGYTSKIDGSIQPYGIVIPAGFDPTNVRPRRLDIWFHGRGEKLSEVTFLNKQSRDLGQYAPDDTIVLHPYGRYSNAFKFAGEVDVLEAKEYVQSKLPIDKNRISVRGFSMGGAACWQFATHYADRWFAANPGAGFSETPEFLASFQNEDVRSTAPQFQQRLWQLYDCPPWAINLAQCPTIAYSGEIDRQKQAADVMQKRLESIGIDLVHVIGPQTGHKIHPDSKIEIERRMRALASAVRPSIPNHIQFTTATLRYPRMHWVKLTGLESHWTPATVEAEVDDALLRATTENVSRIAFDFKSGQWPGKRIGQITVEIDGDRLAGPLVRSDQSWTWELEKQDDHWAPASNEAILRKRPGLQGPIDDAFMDSFLFVLPSGHSEDEVVEKWVESESLHAMHHWRKHFRGDIRKKLDSEVTADDMDSANLILFGDPESNRIIQLISGELPLQWEADRITLGEFEVDRKHHVPVLIYPNPLNPNHYVVINSGFTFREYDYLNNARQTPKLPDWALLDVTDGPTNQLPGKIRAAGFFNESWMP
ncbi:MAG: prolyl oligopeptidase family serine peptidase [Rubripirellula sp.]|jgi:pimeloyl-ACP methyl ester carboxylesterase|nr:prolyl oligopeptidase family serine peptidase [Rubripirellula sp.]